MTRNIVLPVVVYGQCTNYTLSSDQQVPTLPDLPKKYHGITERDPEIRKDEHAVEDKSNPYFEQFRLHIPKEVWDMYTITQNYLYPNSLLYLIPAAIKEIRDIAKSRANPEVFCMNNSIGGEHPKIDIFFNKTQGKLYGGWREPGSGSGARWVCFNSSKEYWQYNNNLTGECYENSDLRTLARILKAKDLLDIVDPVLWQKSLQISDEYRLKIKKNRNYLGAFSLSIYFNSYVIQKYIFRYYAKKRGIRFQRTKLSALLQDLIDHPKVNLKEIFFDFNYFMYCATAIVQGHYDFDHKLVKKSFMSEETWNQLHSFTLNEIDKAIDFLKVAEYNQSNFILKGQQVLTKYLNT